MKWQYHVSGALLMSRCAYRWYLENVEGVRAPTRTFLAAGTGIDLSVGRNLGHKIETDELLEPEECTEIARDETAKRLDKDDFELTRDELPLGKDRARGAAIDRAARLSLVHRQLLAPTMHPSHVARRFTIDVRGYDYQLVGEMDIREQANDLVIIRDTKSRQGRAPKATEAKDSTQLTMYAMGEMISSGKPPDLMALDFLVDYKAKPRSGPGREAWERTEDALGATPEGVPMIQVTERKQADFRPLLDRFQVLDQARKAGIFYPADPGIPGMWWCSETHCPHWRDCPYVRKPVSSGGGLVQIGGSDG